MRLNRTDLNLAGVIYSIAASSVLALAIGFVLLTAGCDTAAKVEREANAPKPEPIAVVSPQPVLPPVFEIGPRDWPQFRNADIQSTQNSPDLPQQWSDETGKEQGIKWAAALPGRGSSSPIVIGDRVFVTAHTGYGISPTDRGNISDLRLHLICKDRETGSTIWQRDIAGSPLTQPLDEIVLGHGFASSTPGTDGQYVYVFFGNSGVFAFDMNGKLKWQQNVGPHYDHFGSSASMTFHKNLLIVNASVEFKTVFAFDKKTGAAVWKIDDVVRCFSMPVVGTAEDGSQELILSSQNLIRGFDPDTGEPLWSCEGVPNYIVSVPLVHDGICYCNGGLQQEIIAIRLGGRGDITKTHQIYNVAGGSNVASPVWHDGILFLAHDNGIMQSFDPESGKLLSRSRTGTKTRIYANPFLNGEEMYLALQDEGVVVVAADEKMKEVRRNRISQDPGPWHSSLAASQDRFFIRSSSFLYCLATHDGPATTIKQPAAENSLDLITPPLRPDFDEKTNRLQYYCSFLHPRPETVAAVLLGPYKSVITDEQTNRSREIITANFERFEDLRLEQIKIFFEFMRGDFDRTELDQRLKLLETDTMAYSNEVRILIKQLFSPEQMDQHKKEAEAWKVKQAESNAANK